MSADQTKNRQLWVNIFFALVATITVIDGVLIAKKSHDWILSDWLINYEGGFVRRGLPGEAALLLSRMTHLRPEVFVVIFYLGCFLVFLASMRKLVLASSLNFWVILSVISPATFSFQILHVEGGYRKEILFLASLSLLAWVLLRRNIRKATLILALTIGAGCGVLSHELILFYLPYIAGLLLLSGRSPKQMAVIFSAPLVLAFLLTWICSHHTGNAKIASEFAIR
jgi:hypothetical protein